MYYYITGEIIEKKSDCVIIDNSGIAYLIFVSEMTSRALPNPTEKVKLFLLHYVREKKAYFMVQEQRFYKTRMGRY